MPEKSTPERPAPEQSTPEKPSPDKYMLVIEDSDEDFEALQRILIRNCDMDIPVIRCCDGDEGLDFLNRQGDFAEEKMTHLPSLILLDLNLPGSDGREILSHIKRDNQLKIIPVIVFTTSSNPKDVDSCYECGANGYLIKPMDIQQLKTSVGLFLDYWFKATQLPNLAW